MKNEIKEILKKRIYDKTIEEYVILSEFHSKLWHEAKDKAFWYQFILKENNLND